MSGSTTLTTWRRGLLRCGLVVVGVVTGLSIAEVAVRVRRALVDDYRTVADAELGHRVVPRSGGSDAWGFNNDTVPARADIVAIGDSQTWGWWARRSEAWPQVLSELTGTTVYNLGMGKYGPVQYQALMERALRLTPRVIVVGLFLGNDLYDAYSDAYCGGQLELRSSDALGCVGEPPESIAAAHSVAAFRREARAAETGWRYRLSDRSALFALLAERRLWIGRRAELYEIARGWVDAHPEFGSSFEASDHRTVFTAPLTTLKLDLGRSEVAAGLVVTKRVLDGIHELTVGAGAELLVILIPTKVSAYSDAVGESPGGCDETFQSVVESEATVVADLTRHLEPRGVAVLHPLSQLRAAIASGVQVTQESFDNHYNAAGYRILAEAVADELCDRGWL